MDTRYRFRWAALATLLVAEAMNLLDSTIVTVAAPVIHAGLGGAASDVQWFAAAYTLPFAVLLITGGRLGDILGRRRVFEIGVAGFVLASLTCALAVSPGMLIAARAVQGAAAALVVPQTFGIIRGMFAGAELSAALGTIGPVMGLAAVCGPVLGGALTQADLFGSSWRAVFLVNVPLGIGVLACARLLREAPVTGRPRLDVTGTLLVVLGTGLVVYPLIETWSWALFAAGAGVLTVFGLHQRGRGPGPLVTTSLFRDRGFAAALATSVLFFAVVTGLTLVVVLQVQFGRHASALTAGLTLLPWSAGMAVASLVAGAWLVPRYGARLLFAGLPVLLAGVVAYALGVAPTVALAVTGVGQGLFAVPFFTVALHRVRPEETGSAAGLLNAVQQFGATLGTALFGSVFLHTAAAPPAFWAGAGVLAATAVTAAAMVPGRAR